MDGKETSQLKTQPEGQVPLAEELPSTEKKTKPEIDPRRVAVEKRLADHKKSERGETKRIEPEQPISKSNSVSPESTLIWMVQIISLVAKRVIKELTTSDPSSNQINYVKFTVVFAASLATKEYLGNPKILPEFIKNFLFAFSILLDYALA
ncbi:hypothetical protein pdam_00018205 [Pocillopora damicornis]|uniref:Uncharacterized protein n=1 Tax=Pocillopora damicornis TaxID=46731 RepID=A0A3M6U9K3_POCDA|nr:hypothetical protein pdam_00018205 [Pocillopora damicornis]